MVTDFRETRVYNEAFEDGFQQGLKQGYAAAFKIGLEAGLKQATLVIARRMLVGELTSAQIEESTGLSLATIQRLKRKRKKEVIHDQE
jgi:predicted transposase YdaD